MTGRLTETTRRRVVIAPAFIAASIAVASVFAASSAAGKAVPASEWLSVLAAPATVDERRSPPSIEVPAGVDPGEARLVGGGLGRFASQLVVSGGRGMICYGLSGSRPVDPAMSYCWHPKSPELPDGLAGKHFHAVALESNIAGDLGVQLFGVAFDDVVRIRVRVAGAWREVPLLANGFYLDLPGIRHEEVGIVEATFGDGTTQVHDIQTGR
jgi:hypothetical protein